VRSKWYKGPLRVLAEAIDKEAEFDFCVGLFHGCVHSSAYAVKCGPPLIPEAVMTMVSIIAARMLRVAQKAVEIAFDQKLQRIIDALGASSFLETGQS